MMHQVDGTPPADAPGDDSNRRASSSEPLGPSRDPERVRSMFAGIAGRYDLVNRILSGGIDTRWRRRVVARAGGNLAGRLAIDVACGTGDLAAVLRRAGARTLGVDFTHEMLALAPPKVEPGMWVQGDALALPVRSSVADVVTIAFGLRNVADRRACFREFRRVLRPGGRAIILEFGMPDRDLFGRAYRGYLTHVLPRVGGALTGDRQAYTYLDGTVQAWPERDQLQREMEEDGFVDCGHERLMRGIACLHYGSLPAESPSTSERAIVAAREVR